MASLPYNLGLGSRRPYPTPTAISPELQAEILRLLKQLTEEGLDAGPKIIMLNQNTDIHVINQNTGELLR